MRPESCQWTLEEFEPEGDPLLLLGIARDLERAGNLEGAARCDVAITSWLPGGYDTLAFHLRGIAWQTTTLVRRGVFTTGSTPPDYRTRRADG